MDNHLGAITLVIGALLLFGIWIYSINTNISPAIESTGQGFQEMVDSTFEGIDGVNTGPGAGGDGNTP